MNRIFTTLVPSPLGTLRVLVDDHGNLVELRFPDVASPAVAGAEDSVARCSSVVRQLREYFAGRRRGFDLPLSAAGTVFQREVWDELQRIPYGETISYGELARRIGRPRAVRAVGQANRRNPIPIVVPCHRVLGADGTLTGFGGGLPIKRALLELERATL
ncbi:MAG: methylated-DNA--[protein]-cysteine S-methyltransferase [Planctomycetes bacterium]|nr:methylated-DNA--[protein]-cysteine S-methyltransferase [Planctomycetota bacterium]MCB9871414.1 methylated-DNA--[protein]-cysteine S-methyltransferase [Planctomycetota bacterium]MCB9888707.1 methylated-DNA--[protein]-cysteine S-methyltransferase [Planctomycetota bacterium]